MKITVIMPTYNAEKYVRATVQSVLNQNYPNVEILIADGGSHDGTVDLVLQMAPEIARVVSCSDKGQLDGVCRALPFATGDVCFWLNADDIVMPGAFTHVASLFHRMPDCDYVFSDNFAFSELHHKLYVGPTIRFLTRAEHELFYRQLYSECVYFRRRVLQNDYGWINTTLRVYTDYEFFLNTLCGCRGVWTSKRLGAFRVTPDQASRVYSQRKLFEFKDVRGRFYSKVGISAGGRFIRRAILLPRFTVLSLGWPILERSFRFLSRTATKDSKRLLQTRLFFSWLSDIDLTSKNDENDPSNEVDLERILYR